MMTTTPPAEHAPPRVAHALSVEVADRAVLAVEVVERAPPVVRAHVRDPARRVRRRVAARARPAEQVGRDERHRRGVQRGVAARDGVVVGIVGRGIGVLEVRVVVSRRERAAVRVEDAEVRTCLGVAAAHAAVVVVVVAAVVKVVGVRGVVRAVVVKARAEATSALAAHFLRRGVCAPGEGAGHAGAAGGARPQDRR